MYAQGELSPWVDAALEAAGGIEPFDVHVHVGLHDPAGYEVTAEEALDALRAVRSRAIVLALKEPTGYAEANHRIRELARAHPGRLRALARLDPAAEPLAEAKRGLDAGAVGLKLHPRGEAFELDDPRLDGAFDLASERHALVLVHAGVGDQVIGPQALARARRHPGARIVLAHCAVGAFAQVVPRAREVRNLYFDTSWWNPADVLALLRLVPPGRVLYGSDIPFGSPSQSLVHTARLALQAGLSQRQVAGVLGGQLERLVSGEAPLDLGDAPEGDLPALPPELERVYVTLCATVEPMLRGEPPGQGLDLVRTTCEAAAGEHEAVLRSVGELLALAEAHDQPDPLRPLRTPGWDLVLTAAVVARTPDVLLP